VLGSDDDRGPDGPDVCAEGVSGATCDILEGVEFSRGEGVLPVRVERFRTISGGLNNPRDENLEISSTGALSSPR
jgi:hypothetical protein